MSIYGNTTDVKLEQTSKEEQEKALQLLEQVEREIEELEQQFGDGSPDATLLDLDEETSRHLKVRVNRNILNLIDAKDTRRQRMEEVRANHRNMNRMLTLMVAIVLGFVVTYGLSNMGFPFLGIHFPKWVAGWGPYSFVITVTLDFFLALYAYVRHY